MLFLFKATLDDGSVTSTPLPLIGGIVGGVVAAACVALFVVILVRKKTNVQKGNRWR